jgi:hypothetical protein
MQAYGGGGGVGGAATLILKPVIDWSARVDTPRPLYPWGKHFRYPSYRRLDGPQNRYERSQKGKISCAPSGNLTRMILAGCCSERKIFVSENNGTLRHTVCCARFCAFSASWVMWYRLNGPGLEPQALRSFSEDLQWTSSWTYGCDCRKTRNSLQLGCDVTRLTCVRKVACSTLGHNTGYS